MKKMNICYNSKHFFNVLLLIVALLGININVLAAWSGSGTAVSGSGTTWYVYDEASEKSKTAGGLIAVYYDELSLSGPGAKVTFEAKKTKYGSGDLKLRANNGSWHDVFNNGLSTSYQSYSADLNVSDTKIQFYISSGSLKKYYKNLKVAMAQYIENPSETSLAFGSGKVDDANTTQTFTIAWCNVPAMTYSKTGSGSDKISVEITDNSAYGKYNTATVKVTYNRNAASTLNATLTISDTYGGYSKNITLTGSTSKYDQTLSWSGDVIENMLVGTTQSCAATINTGRAITYTSSNSDILSVDVNGQLTAKAVGGPVTITASEPGNYKYKAATSLTRTFYVKTKDTPIFTPHGFSKETTCNLKVGDKVTLDVAYVSAGLAGDFKATATGTNVLGFTREGNTITIEALNAGTSTATFTQTENSDIFKATESYSFSVTKYQTSFSGPAYDLMVDDTQMADYSYTNTSAAQPTANSSDDFYYTIDEVDFANEELNKGADLVTFNPSNKQITACNAGTAKITLHQKETYKYTGATKSFVVSVSKYTPNFTWNSTGKTYYYQSTISSIFSTTGPNAYTIVSDNEASAKVVDNTLHIYNVDETANITVTQVENYKWNGKEKTYTITPVELNNHVEFTISNSNHSIFETGSSFSSSAAWSNPGYRLGDGGWLTQDDYAIIRFAGIPDKLYFDKSLEESVGQLPGTHLCQVYESNDGSNWGKAIWTHDERVANKNGNEVQLKPTTRYVKFAYHGTVYCNYKNIHITELNQFSASPVRVDFGTKGANFGTQEENVTFNHANAGRVTTMEIVGDDAEFFSIERSSIPGTGRDLYGTFTIAVRFDNKGEVRGEAPYNAELHIVDNAEHELNIPLTGIRNGKTNPTFIFNANYLPYYINTNIANVASSTNTDYTNCPLMFETSDASVAQVIDGTLHIYNKKQPVTITIRQRGNEDYDEGSAAFTFTPREMPSIRVPFQMSKAIYDESTPGYMCAWDGTDNEIRLGKAVTIFEAEAYDWEKKSFIISFAGTPGRISFMYKTSTSSSTSAKGILKGAQWMVEESADGRNWSVIWDVLGSPDDWQTVNELNLKPTTRYVRFSFLGNFAGYYKNINISELVGYKYLRAETDGRYLSRGAIYGTQAIVDDFGVPCRISNYTTDNTNVYTRFLFVDNQQYLYEADNHEIYTDDGTAQNAYNLWKQNVTDGTILTFQSGNEYPGDSRKGQYITLDGDALALTADAAAATKWQMEDYTEHPAHILEILNREAAEAASHDFATDVTTLEKVRSRVAENDFERTDIAVPALTLGERVSDYALDNTIEGPRAIYDNEITDLQPGFYRLTVKAFSRISSANMAWACHTAGAGMESVLAYIYANDVKYPIQSLYHSYQASPLEPSDELRGGYYYSTDLTSAGEAFDDAKRYLNDVYVYVEADPGKTTGTLRYGIKNPSYVPGAWLAFEEITLTRFARKEYIFNGESTTGETTDWQMGGNWNRNTQPDYRHVVSVQHDLVIDEEVSVYSLVIENDKSGNPVTVTIAPTGGLTVGAGGVKNATKDNFILQAGTTGATKGQTGYLRISPYTREPMPEATVQLFSIGYYDKYAEDTDDDNVAAWQYVGTPIDFKGALAKTAFTRSWIYSYDQTSDSWVNNRKNLVMQPFVGYATTQYDSEEGKLIEYKGTLQPNGGVQTIKLAYTDDEHGYNVVANSFAAPIDITKMRKEDFIHVEDPTIYLFHTGTRQQAEENSGTEGNNAGQFISIAIGTAAEMEALFADDDIPTVIAPMQGFGIYASEAGGQIRLDYTKLVWNADYAAHPNKPLRVAQIHEEGADSIDKAEITGALKMTISAEGRSDKCYLIESDRYDSFYEAGYDASKKMSGRLNIFTVADDDKLLAVNATNSIIGTRVGVRTGEEMTYTMTFSHINSEENWMLWDKEAGFKMLLSEDVEYTFNAAPNSEITERFQIIAADIPAVTTGVDEVESEVHVQKFIKDNQLYILKDGVLYNASGAVVRK